MLLGCIADDFTGATDLAGMLVKGGMRTIQTIGVPVGPVPDVEAVVVALKSRTNPPEDAIRDSLAALAWLQGQGVRQVYFKYCSTFDSTQRGNIGPVAGALLHALGDDFTVVCPAFPANKRTVYKGILFVGDVPLDESPMRHHPLNPMRDASLVRLMAAQTPHKVGLADRGAVRGGVTQLQERFAQLRQDGVRYAVVDALDDTDLITIGAACADMKLVTGGSGLALGLTQNFAGLAGTDIAAQLSATPGFRAVIAGSCSVQTQRQVAIMRETHDVFAIDAVTLADDHDVVGEALDWAMPRLGSKPILIYSTAAHHVVQAAQARLGAGTAGNLVENALARIAVGLVNAGVRQMIVAGGETSGAVVQALGIASLRIGQEIDPGVPWTVGSGAGRPSVALALKSGNFGRDRFFIDAWNSLPATRPIG